ncbi:MAG TPA: hypothetical protein VLS90_00590 [Thermodesulfobacteriota bacterium]|nr:hypothetical protein [Thermodesulfobacteriota bacterium]
MRVKPIAFLSLAAVLFSAGLLRADCMDFSRSTSWSIDADQKIIFFRGAVPFAAIVLQDCPVNPNSNVRITKPYMCDSDKVIVDGTECGIVSLNSLE